MDFTYIDRCVDAANKIHNAFENCKNGHFIWGEWDCGMYECLRDLNPANGLKNEYTRNHIEAVALGAAGKIELNELYRSRVETCIELCPYPPSELFWKVEPPHPFYVPSREWLEGAIDIDKSTCILTWPVMRQLDIGKFDYDEAGDWLIMVSRGQTDVYNSITKLEEWWQEVELHPELNPLYEYSKSNTRRAQKMFSRAVRAKFMDVTDTGYVWKLTKAGLAYFLNKVYNEGGDLPQAELNRMFDAKRLSQAVRDTEHGVCRDAGLIDGNIFYDE